MPFAVRQLDVDLIYPTWSQCLPQVVRGLVFPPLARCTFILYERTSNINYLHTSIKFSFAALATTPCNHPRLPHYQHRLASALRRRYRQLGDEKDISLATLLQKAAVRSVPPNHPDFHWHRWGLFATYRDRYRAWGKLEDLEAEINLHHSTISILSPQSPHLSSWQEELVFAYHTRYERLGRPVDVDRQLEIALAAHDAISSEDPHRPALKRDLALAYSDRFRLGRNPEDSIIGLFWGHSAVDSTPRSTQVDLGCREQTLSNLYSDSYEVTGALEDLVKAIHFCQRGIEHLSDSTTDISPCYHSLAHCHNLKFDRLGHADDLQAMIDLSQKAYERSPEGHPHRGIYANTLAIGLQAKYTETGNLEDLEAAVRWGEIAANVKGQGPGAIGTHHHTYAHILLVRYRRHRNRRDWDVAIKYANSSIKATTSNPSSLALRKWTLSSLYRSRFNQDRNTDDLRIALELQESVVAAISPSNMNATHLYRSLSELHSEFYRHVGGVQHRDAAMKWGRVALDACKPDDPNRPMAASSLMIQYFNRYTQLCDFSDLEHALKLGYEVVETMPPDHPRMTKYLQSIAGAHVERYSLFREAQDHDLALQYFARSCATSNGDPGVLWTTMRRWASFADTLGASECINAYKAAYRILPELFWLGSDMKSRHETLVKYEVTQVTSQAIAACIRSKELEMAVEFMEQSLSLTFQQLLDLRTDLTELREKFPGYASMLEKISLELRTLVGSSTVEAEDGEVANWADWDKQRKLAIERSALLRTIRELPGFEGFLLPVTFKSLAAAADGGPIVILNQSPKSCDAVVLLPGGRLLHVPLPGIRPGAIPQQTSQLRLALGSLGIQSRGRHVEDRLPDLSFEEGVTGMDRGVRRQRKDPSLAINNVLGWLWTVIVSPIFHALAENGISEGRLWWCPTGSLTKLPLHAAGPPNRFIQSYTSTLSALNRARTSHSQPCSEGVFAIGVVEIKGSRVPPLPNVEVEIEALREVVGEDRTSVLFNEQVTLKNLSDLLPRVAWLHLACHGQQGNAQDPLKSGLLLADGTKLDLETIINTNIPNAEFVFLSACETAMGDADMTGESLHLAGGMIFAGFKAVIGTLWSINDLDGPMVTRAVYSHILKKDAGRPDEEPDVTKTAEALDRAVKDMRARGVPPHRWVPFIHIGL